MSLYFRAVPFIIVLACYSGFTHAESLEQQSTRALQQQRQLEQRLNKNPAVNLSSHTESAAFDLYTPESPCVPIHQIQLKSDENWQFILEKTLHETQFQPGMCLGIQGIEYLQNRVQHHLISQGWITSRVTIEPQDLNSGILALTAVAGKIEQIQFQDSGKKLNALGRFATFPTSSGKLLQLKDLEIGLENLRRLSDVESNIQILPAEKTPNTSQLLITRHQPRWAHIAVGVNNFGSRITGKYQGNVNLTLNNPFGINDLFYAQYQQDLGRHKTHFRDHTGKKTKSGMSGLSLHYSFPMGKWLFSANHSRYVHHEANEGFYLNYDYKGVTDNTNVGVSREVFRYQTYKTTLGAKLWRFSFHKLINDEELDVQRRKMGGWEVMLQQNGQMGNVQFAFNTAYKRGTGIFNSQAAPEEFNADNDAIPGTSRMKIITANFWLYAPFQRFKQHFSFDTNISMQWNKTPLVPQDKLAIGGQYSIRGFDGEHNLTGERGWYWQNNLNWHYAENHQVYLGLDSGYVSGISTNMLSSRRLTGGIVGIKGAVRFLNGSWNYELFIGKPLYKPSDFQTSHTTYGCSLSYRY